MGVIHALVIASAALTGWLCGRIDLGLLCVQYYAAWMIGVSFGEWLWRIDNDR